MPYRTKYEIYDTSHIAAVYTGYDKTMAFVTWEDFIRNPKGECYRMVQIVEPVGELTKSEEYLFLVYHVRRLIKRYFNNGRKHEDMIESQEYETKLDKWNQRTQAFINSHPGYKPTDEKSHAFYVLVSTWRKVFKERMAYRKRKMGFDQAVFDEMNKKRQSLEKQIDKYIKEQFQLL